MLHIVDLLHISISMIALNTGVRQWGTVGVNGNPYYHMVRTYRLPTQYPPACGFPCQQTVPREMTRHVNHHDHPTMSFQLCHVVNSHRSKPATTAASLMKSFTNRGEN